MGLTRALTREIEGRSPHPVSVMLLPWDGRTTTVIFGTDGEVWRETHWCGGDDDDGDDPCLHRMDLPNHKSTIEHCFRDMVFEHSQKYCETLVAAGAVNIIVKQLHTLNRGFPDQEILKHVLCTLVNIVRYPHLAQVFVNTSQSVETIFQELLRNKGEGYFMACDILKNLCSTEDGLEAIKRLQGHVRRLKSLVQDLERNRPFVILKGTVRLLSRSIS